jgi:hypothetical protein
VNAFFDDLAERWRAAAQRRGAEIAPPGLDPAIAQELLELARVVAHSKERSFAPLASFTAGLATERLRIAQPDADLTSFIREVRQALERESRPD